MNQRRSPEPVSDSGAPHGRTPPLDWAHAAGAEDLVEAEIEGFVRRRRRRRAVVASSLALALVVAGITWRTGYPPLAIEPAAESSTVVTLPTQRVLPDGTVVELKPGAQIAVDFSSSALRRVVLTEGQAHFTVSKDPQRPFVVEAGKVAVRAVGTAFAVDLGGAEVAVLVTEGRVAVAPPREKTASTDQAAPVAAPTLVDAGNRALVRTADAVATPKVESVSAAEITEHLAWRVPRLEFNATPLGDVVALFNRHAVERPGEARTRLVLGDADVGKLPLSGVLRADNVGVLLQIMATSYGIAAESQADGTIVLRKGR